MKARGKCFEIIRGCCRAGAMSQTRRLRLQVKSALNKETKGEKVEKVEDQIFIL